MENCLAVKILELQLFEFRATESIEVVVAKVVVAVKYKLNSTGIILKICFLQPTRNT